VARGVASSDAEECNSRLGTWSDGEQARNHDAENKPLGEKGAGLSVVHKFSLQRQLSARVDFEASI
jgi:hypothetical protein